VWRVKLVAELQPGVTTETKMARIERDKEASLAELGLRLEEAKQIGVSFTSIGAAIGHRPHGADEAWVSVGQISAAAQPVGDKLPDFVSVLCFNLRHAQLSLIN
jgi:hypothetical protein